VVVISPAVIGLLPMSKIEAIGSKAADSTDWNHAWSVVAQLAAARGATLRELDPDGPRVALGSPATAARTPAQPAVDLPFPAVAPDQLDRDMAEIERAAAALRRAEPGLERRLPHPPASIEAAAARSVWPLLCVIWLTAVAVVSGAIGTIVLLLG
jgi:hypothetical protein